MKKILYFASFALLAGLLVTSSCTKDEDVNPFHGLSSKGAVAIVTNVVNGFFDLASPAASSIAFDLGTKGEAVSSLLITKSINGGAESDLTTITSFPSTIDVTFDQALAGTGIDASDLAPGDNAVFSFYLTTPTGTYPGGTLGIDMSCVSSLEGVYAVSTVGWCGDVYEGMTEWVAAGAGAYNVIDPADPENPAAGDFSYGAYVACYGGAPFPEGDLQILDVCNKITPIGKSQWGEVYTYNSITVDGNKLTIDWKNDYDPEAGVTTLTRTDGTDWPPLTN